MLAVHEPAAVLIAWSAQAKGLVVTPLDNPAAARTIALSEEPQGIRPVGPRMAVRYRERTEIRAIDGATIQRLIQHRQRAEVRAEVNEVALSDGDKKTVELGPHQAMLVVDVIGIGLYFAKDVKFVGLLYVLLLVLAIRGLINWRKAGGQ